MAWRIGVDSGGTFTDICLFDESNGRIAVWKVSSTPADPSSAVAEGVREALAQVAAPAGDALISAMARRLRPMRSFSIVARRPG